MNKIIVLFTLLLVGCETVPVQPVYPELPVELQKECSELHTIEGTSTTLSVLMETVAKNYNLYHQCSAQTSALIEWQRRQLELINSKK